LRTRGDGVPRSWRNSGRRRGVRRVRFRALGDDLALAGRRRSSSSWISRGEGQEGGQPSTIHRWPAVSSPKVLTSEEGPRRLTMRLLKSMRRSGRVEVSVARVGGDVQDWGRFVVVWFLVNRFLGWGYRNRVRIWFVWELSLWGRNGAVRDSGYQCGSPQGSESCVMFTNWILVFHGLRSGVIVVFCWVGGRRMDGRKRPGLARTCFAWRG